MPSALLIRLRPAGPWRFGPGDGALDRTDTLYRSDRLYSAVTLAFEKLGFLDEWLAATALAPHSAVAFSSLFPFQGDSLFAIPPATLWPPAAAQVTGPNPAFLAKIRWKAALFVPLSVIDSLATGGRLLADQWLPDAASGCLLRRDRPNSSPFRSVLRRTAAVDRLARTAPAFTSTACVEFEPGAGLWTLARFANEAAENTWSERLQSAFRLLADSGFGGRRSNGWGHSKPPEFEHGSWPALLLPKLGRLRPEPDGTANYWLLSLYSPASSDRIDWQGGSYRLTLRSGPVESRVSLHAAKKTIRMISEGSVLAAPAEPLGTAVNVSPDGFAHPVYRSGVALALALPSIPAPAELEPVEAPEPELAEDSETPTEAPPPVESEGPADHSTSLPAPPAEVETTIEREKPTEPEAAPLAETPHEAPSDFAQPPAGDQTTALPAPPDTSETPTEPEPPPLASAEPPTEPEAKIPDAPDTPPAPVEPPLDEPAVPQPEQPSEPENEAHKPEDPGHEV